MTQNISQFFHYYKNKVISDIEKVCITASGGPFIDLPKNQFKRIKLNDALKHPNWIMGKKITIDSATLMNKVFEVIEAKNIFNISYKKYQYSLIHNPMFMQSLNLKMV